MMATEKRPNGRPRNHERWERARELAATGVWMSKGARMLGVHNTTAMYMARCAGFKWGKAPDALPPLKKIAPAPQAAAFLELPEESLGFQRIHRMVELAAVMARKGTKRADPPQQAARRA